MTTTTTTLRRCTGSARYGIAPHEAPIERFPKQPSQKDGLGRMCTEHWRAYTSGLRQDALTRKAEESEVPTTPATSGRRTRAAANGKADEVERAEALTGEPGATPAGEMAGREGDVAIETAPGGGRVGEVAP